MKRPLQLSLAIALALGVTDAFALGLGAIQVRSGLNQPLNAEIPVIQGTPGEAEGLIVQLASSEDFDRVGLDRSSIGVPIEFSLGKNARGEPVIRITSKDIVREPFLGFLVEANWPKGRLLREYTLLLDPPVMAPAVKGSSAIAVAAKDPERAPTEALPAAKPAPAPPAAKPAAAKPAAVAAEPAPKVDAAPRQVSGSEYGPVAAGETLGEVARATRPNDSVTVNQMMLALLKHNPRAFYRDNINALKRGAVLRIPSADEISANGSAREAAASVRLQVEEWRSGSGAVPTLVADTTPVATAVGTSRPAASTAAAPSRGERLALVPPREGRADQQSADRPSGGTANSGDAASRAELARVKEALTSREQESGELRSRVKDLEDIKGKNDKLIALQNSELAELRDKLKALQEQSAKAAAAPPPVAVVASPAPAAPAAAPAISKDDIWGDGDKAGAGKQPVVPSSEPGPATTTPPPGAPAEPAASTSAAIDPAPASTAPSPDAKAVADAAVPATTPPAATPAAEPVSKPEPVAAKPAVAKKPVAAPRPAEPQKPWYLEPWVLGAAGLGGLLLVLAGVAGMRRRKAADSVARPSIANTFANAPLTDSLGGQRASDAEEEQLVEQVRRDPGNAGAHLELLSLYYAQRETGKFEAAAEEMYAYVADPNQAEWREARAMGEELVPHNPLFGGASDLSDLAGGDRGHARSEDGFSFDEPAAGDGEPYRFSEVEEPAPGAFATTAMPAFNYDAPGKPMAAESFDFDLPPIEPVADAPIVTEFDLDDEPEPAAMAADDEFFAGDDAIGTKLDLAKAYLDMGDPDGARAMLEEVIAEGNASQQGEARKLLGEIH